MAPKKEPTKWEIAKPILEEMYLKGEITDDMPRGVVHKLRKEFEDVPINNFLRMKNTVADLKERADDDAELLQFDLGIYALASEKHHSWDGSLAQASLIKDLEEGKHVDMKPKDLWLSRQEYQHFKLKTFRDHINQEERAKRETNYWIVKKKKQKGLRRLGVVVDDDDFFATHFN